VFQVDRLAVRQGRFDICSRSELFTDVFDSDSAVFLDGVVIRGIRESQRKDSEVDEVRLVDPRERPRDNDPHAEVARDECGVLPARPLAVVLAADDDAVRCRNAWREAL